MVERNFYADIVRFFVVFFFGSLLYLWYLYVNTGNLHASTLLLAKPHLRGIYGFYFKSAKKAVWNFNV